MNWQDDLRFKAIARSTKPILVGPWRSEVGFESLYWLPWLSAFRKRWKIDRDRLVVVSRGGAGVWYDAGRVVELYDYVSVARLRKAQLEDSARTGSVKQQQIRPWERTLLAAIAADIGLRRYHVLHPSVMYNALTPWWEGAMGHAELMTQLSFEPMHVPHAPLSLVLPERFASVGFYARHTWPLTEESLDLVNALVERLAARIPVVLLNSGVAADDHVPFPIAAGKNISTISGPHLLATNNLAVQSAVLAKAQAFVGTYGGLMQLAVRLGKPVMGFYAKFEGTAYAHKHLTEWLGVQQQLPVWIGRPDDARFVTDVTT